MEQPNGRGLRLILVIAPFAVILGLTLLEWWLRRH